jgi:uncharacterized membrane protein
MIFCYERECTILAIKMHRHSFTVWARLREKHKKHQKIVLFLLAFIISTFYLSHSASEWKIERKKLSSKRLKSTVLYRCSTWNDSLFSCSPRCVLFFFSITLDTRVVSSSPLLLLLLFAVAQWENSFSMLAFFHSLLHSCNVERASAKRVYTALENITGVVVWLFVVSEWVYTWVVKARSFL